MSKYKNPIVKLETVKIPTWEYAALVKQSTILEMIQRIVNEVPDYQMRDVLKMLFGNDKEDEE